MFIKTFSKCYFWQSVLKHKHFLTNSKNYLKVLHILTRVLHTTFAGQNCFYIIVFHQPLQLSFLYLRIAYLIFSFSQPNFLTSSYMIPNQRLGLNHYVREAFLEISDPFCPFLFKMKANSWKMVKSLFQPAHSVCGTGLLAKIYNIKRIE